MLAQQFLHVRLDVYIKEVSIPVFAAKHYWRRFEFDKSRGQIHFHSFAISAGKQPRRLPHALKNGGAQEKAGALATWAWGSLSLTAMRPAGLPNGEIDITLARAPAGEWAPPKDSNAVGLLLRDAKPCAITVLRALIPTAFIHAATTAREPLGAALK